MDKEATVAAFGRLADRDRLRLIDRLAGETDWSRYRAFDALDAALLALAADLAEDEGWGEDAGTRYLGQNVHPAALASHRTRPYIGGTGIGRPSGRMTMATLGFGEAVKRGLQRHCPHCDQPTLFAGYLRVAPHCPHCGAENGRHRVDDIASYFTVLLIGHVLIAPALAIPFFWYIPLWASMSIFLTAMTVATLGALPFIKGGVVGALAATSQRAR